MIVLAAYYFNNNLSNLTLFSISSIVGLHPVHANGTINGVGLSFIDTINSSLNLYALSGNDHILNSNGS